MTTTAEEPAAPSTVEPDRPGPPEPAVRLDPLALPSATTSRFVLLLVTAAGGTAFIAYHLLSEVALPGLGPGTASCYTELARAFRAADRGGALAFYECQRGVQLRFVAAVIGSVVLLGLVTFAVYRLYPLLLIARLRGRPLPELADRLPDDVLLRIRELTDGLRRPVDVRVAMHRPTAGGRAFGRFPRYRIVLDFGLVADPARLEAVLAHEVAHLRNRDIDLTFLAMSVWWAFLAVAGIPLAVYGNAGLWWRAAFVLALIWLVRASVLRTREFYADLRAAGDTGPARALRSLLDEHAAHEPAGRWSRRARIVRYHPLAVERTEILQDAGPLFRLRWVDCFVVGALIGLSFTPLMYVGRVLVGQTVWMGFAVGLVFSALLSGSAGGSVWRQTHQRLASGLGAGGILPAALALAAGVAAGQLVTPPLAAVNDLAGLVRAEPGPGVVLLLLLVVLSYAMLRWFALCAEGWLPAAVRPRRAYRAGIVVGALALGGWLFFWFQVQSLMLQSRNLWDIMSIAGFSVGLNQPMLVGAALGVLYPALAWARVRLRRRAEDRPLPGAMVSPPAALLFGLALAVAVSLVPLLLQDQIRRADAAARGATTVDLGGFLVTLVTAVLLAAVLGLALGAWRGGRGGTARAVAVAALGVLLVTPYVVLATFMHLFLTECGDWDAAVGCLRRMPTTTYVGSASIGCMWFAAVAATGVLAAAVGSAGRALAQTVRGTRPVPVRVPPRRRPIRAVAAVLPFLLMSGVWAYPVLRSVTLGVDGLGDTQHDRIVAQRPAAPNSWRAVDACDRIHALFNDFALHDVVDGAGTREAQAVTLSLGSDDGVLAALGYELGQAMFDRDPRRSGHLATGLSWYCDAYTGAYGPLRPR